MTEVPEHLLARSRARRAAMGGGGDDTGADAGGGAGAGESGGDAAAAAPVAAAAVAPVADATPAPPPEPEPVAPYVEAALERKKMPVWIAPVIALLPIWAIFYVGTIEAPTEEAEGLLAEGEAVYANCAGCHGGAGQGGSGPQLNQAEVLLTFPNPADHIAWVINGSPAANGTPYGDPDRPGGQRLSAGGMAGWTSLSAEELLAVVYYERVAHGELDPAAAALELEALEAWLESGEVEFAGGETPEDIAAELDEFLLGEGGDEEAAE